MELLQSGLHILNNVPADAWGLIVEILVSAIVVSPLALTLKKWWSVHSEKIMLLLVVAGSMLTSALFYLKDVPEIAPWIILVQGWLVFATTQPVYFLFIKPLSFRLGVWFNDQVEKAAAVKALQDDLKSAIEPADGLQVAPVAQPASLAVVQPSVEEFEP